MMTKVMKMRTGMARSKPQSDMPDQVKEHRHHGGVAQGCPFDGNEYRSGPLGQADYVT